MRLQPRWISVLFLVLLLGQDFGMAQTTLRNYRSKNGIRLAGSSGPKGRLEVASKDSWFAPLDGRAGWSPVCDSDDFTDQVALEMCQLLNYSYGRKFYSPLIAYRKNETGVRYVGKIICTPNEMSPPPPPGRRPPPPFVYSNPPPPPPSQPPTTPTTPTNSPPPPASPTTPSLPTSPSLPGGSNTDDGSNGSSSPPPVDSPPAALPSPSSPAPVPGYGPGPTDDVAPAAGPGPGPASHHRHHHRRHQRRHLHSAQVVTAAAVGGAAAAVGGGGDVSSRSRSRSRSLYTPVAGTIASPRSAPYSCTIRPGACDVKGPFVGIECSHTPLTTAPPPPPSPPAPPPAPPAVSGTIRMYGPPLSPNSIVYGDTEPNLINDMLGNFYGRFDVRITVNGTQVWAPLCAPSGQGNPMVPYILGEVACQQVYDWPKPYDGGIGFIMTQLAESSFPIPSGPFGPGDFNPSSYRVYARLVGQGRGGLDELTEAMSVQELGLEASTTPCDMLAAACVPFGERR